MNWKFIGIASSLISVAILAFAIIVYPNILHVGAKYSTLTLEVTDTETGETVDDVEVYVDDVYVGVTAQGGELDIHHLEHGRHRVSVLVPYYEHSKVDKYVDVEGNVTVPVSIDMPNPTFQVSLEVQSHIGFLDEYGTVDVTLTNIGEVVSQDTIVLILVYLEEDTSQPIASRIINFGNVAAGALPVERGTSNIGEFVWLKSERVAAVVIDRWKYTPQNNQPIAQTQVPLGFGETVVLHAFEYVQQHPEVLGTIAQIVLG